MIMKQCFGTAEYERNGEWYAVNGLERYPLQYSLDINEAYCRFADLMKARKKLRPGFRMVLKDERGLVLFEKSFGEARQDSHDRRAKNEFELRFFKDQLNKKAAAQGMKKLFA